MAQYADACNIFGAPDKIRHKLAVLREHCDIVGRDYATIEKTNLTRPRSRAEGTSTRPAHAGRSSSTAWAAWAEAGSQHTIFSLDGVSDLAKLELIGRDVIPQIRDLGSPSPIS